MKKYFVLTWILLLCLSLCACGKSEAVVDVEGLIDAIGVVTLESESAISAAEEAYNALTEEEKAKVENYAVLADAHKALDVALAAAAIAGEWTRDGESVISFYSDGTMSSDGMNGSWEYNSDTDVYAVNYLGLNFEVNLEEIAGYKTLSMLDGKLLYAEDFVGAF